MKAVKKTSAHGLYVIALLFAALSLMTLMMPGTTENLPRLNAVTIKTQAAANKMLTEGAIRGIDVSKWQGDISWSKVAQDNVNFAFIRASYGDTPDEKFVYNARAAHKNGIKVGAYHFARFKDEASMKKEAAFFVSQLKKVDITYPVVLDVEGHHGLSKSKLTSLCKQFMDIVKSNGYNVMFYSYQNFINQYIQLSNLKGYKLWVANYIEKPKNLDFSVWQHTSYGTVKGISGRVDINIATADLSSKRTIYVDPETSDTFKRHLVNTYGADITLDEKIDMKEIGLAIKEGFQIEIIEQFGYDDLDVNGQPGGLEAEILSAIQFTETTKGRITTLLQCRLFYRGLYTQPITGQFDSHTVEALKAFQKEQSLTVTGTMDYDTWLKVFKI